MLNGFRDCIGYEIFENGCCSYCFLEFMRKLCALVRETIFLGSSSNECFSVDLALKYPTCHRYYSSERYAGEWFRCLSDYVHFVVQR